MASGPVEQAQRLAQALHRLANELVFIAHATQDRARHLWYQRVDNPDLDAIQEARSIEAFGAVMNESAMQLHRANQVRFRADALDRQAKWLKQMGY